MIVHENLDVKDECGALVTISGSQCVEDIRKRLPPKLERRLFALIRSAHNSSSDIALYRTRAHGFLPKAPMKRDSVREILAPLWLKRFPRSQFEEDVRNSRSKSIDMCSTDSLFPPYDVAQNPIDLSEHFRIPTKNTFCIAIEDSKIQRKLLGKFFEFMAVPPEQTIIMGQSAKEIREFEDFTVNFLHEHKDDYVLIIADENLEVVDESGEIVSSSGSQCVHNIRNRLPEELEARVLALVRSVNDSVSDIAIYNERAHGFLPKAPIRCEQVNKIIAPLWMKRFPLSDFGDLPVFDTSHEITSNVSEELACSSNDIAEKLGKIQFLFQDNAEVRFIHDQLHELKGDLLTLTCDASMISIVGMINLILSGHQPPNEILDKWNILRDNILKLVQL